MLFYGANKILPLSMPEELRNSLMDSGGTKQGTLVPGDSVNSLSGIVSVCVVCDFASKDCILHSALKTQFISFI